MNQEDACVALLRWQVDFWLLLQLLYVSWERVQEFPGVEPQKCGHWSQLDQVCAAR